MSMRLASPNERRTISREDLGFYNAVVIAAIYNIPDARDLTSAQSFLAPLRQCILEQPYLSVIVKDKHTDKASYEKVSSIDLNNHISIIHDQTSRETETKSLEKTLLPILDRPWPADIPPWRIVILPLAATSTEHDPKTKRCFIAFSFSHTLGDGLSGLIFHRAFLNAWNNIPTPEEQELSNSFLVSPSAHPLPQPFDTPERLPISWKFLLGPLLAACMPKFINDMFGLRASSSPRDAGTWTGAPMFFDPSCKNSSRLRLLEIEAPLVQNALRVSRANETKLTGTIHQMIVRALGRAIQDPQVTNFVSGTAVNMRASIGAEEGNWGLYVSGDYAVHPRPRIVTQSMREAEKLDSTTPRSSSTLPEEAWTSAREITKSLSEASVRLTDQAIGLLRYAPSIRSWTAKHVGGERDCSYRVSNLLAFDGEPEPEPNVDNNESGSESKSKIRISKVVFATPADVTGSPLAFDIVSLRGGSLVCAVGWQVGALGLGVPGEEEEEGADVERLQQRVQDLEQQLEGARNVGSIKIGDSSMQSERRRGWDGIHTRTAHSSQAQWYGPSSSFYFIGRMNAYLSAALE
ncbi:uncharacterized protein BDV17DRAFT_285946 [Aspergillus undulatus]|uniref:uncharacterized protein n=1 Tax=Aspergillus undulatus TaxID=1810928 RepID=UPI003CCE1A51